MTKPLAIAIMLLLVAGVAPSSVEAQQVGGRPPTSEDSLRAALRSSIDSRVRLRCCGSSQWHIGVLRSVSDTDVAISANDCIRRFRLAPSSRVDVSFGRPRFPYAVMGLLIGTMAGAFIDYQLHPNTPGLDRQIDASVGGLATGVVAGVFGAAFAPELWFQLPAPP